MRYKVFQNLAFCTLFLMLCSFDLIKTQLRITVFDDLGNVRKGAKVSLYEKEEDFNNNKPTYGPLQTDEKGKAFFIGVTNGPFIIEVVDGDYSNDFGGQKTDLLEQGKINKINIIISK